MTCPWIGSDQHGVARQIGPCLLPSDIGIPDVSAHSLMSRAITVKVTNRNPHWLRSLPWV